MKRCTVKADYMLPKKGLKHHGSNPVNMTQSCRQRKNQSATDADEIRYFQSRRVPPGLQRDGAATARVEGGELGVKRVFLQVLLNRGVLLVHLLVTHPGGYQRGAELWRWSEEEEEDEAEPM